MLRRRESGHSTGAVLWVLFHREWIQLQTRGSSMTDWDVGTTHPFREAWHQQLKVQLLTLEYETFICFFTRQLSKGTWWKSPSVILLWVFAIVTRLPSDTDSKIQLHFQPVLVETNRNKQQQKKAKSRSSPSITQFNTICKNVFYCPRETTDVTILPSH